MAFFQDFNCLCACMYLFYLYYVIFDNLTKLWFISATESKTTATAPFLKKMKVGMPETPYSETTSSASSTSACDQNKNEKFIVCLFSFYSLFGVILLPPSRRLRERIRLQFLQKGNSWAWKDRTRWQWRKQRPICCQPHSIVRSNRPMDEKQNVHVQRRAGFSILNN